MAVPRTYVRGPLKPGPLELTSAQAKRLAGSHRLRIGDDFLVFCGDGAEWSAKLRSVERNQVRAELIETVRAEPPAPVSLELLCGLVRPARFEWAIEKCVEAGIDVIRPLISENSARGAEPSSERNERWERIAVEAAEQSGRLYVPVIGGIARFDTIIAAGASTVVVCDAGGLPWTAAAARLPRSGAVVIMVGPEGGLSQGELARARASGATIASISPHVLRTETAALAATVLIRAYTAGPA